jgi:hypothetical protein
MKIEVLFATHFQPTVYSGSVTGLRDIKGFGWTGKTGVELSMKRILGILLVKHPCLISFLFLFLI